MQAAEAVEPSVPQWSAWALVVFSFGVSLILIAMAWSKKVLTATGITGMAFSALSASFLCKG